jgi:SRSO17 transposase
MPALDEFLRPFHVHFARSEATHALERYLTGMLTEHPNKNCDTLAQVVPDTSAQSLQGLLTAMRWDEDDLNQQRVQALLALPTEGDAALLFDDTGFAKQGRSSVGVARQYSGTLGKTGNCQVTVNCHYAERTLAWPVATRLYLNKEWAQDRARRQKAKVPEDLAFQTKPEIALDLLDRADAWGVPYACVVADADYGDNPSFLDGLEGRKKRYVVQVRKDFQVALTSDGPAQRVEAVLAALPQRCWQTIRWRQGSKGWLRARFSALRCWRVTSAGARLPGWLIGERPARGARGKRRYHWSNFGAEAALAEMAEYAHRRYGVEQFHEESKGLLGWDQYQGRLWTGFHRNSVLVMLAYSFLVIQEWRQRQQVSRRGQRRRPFSPSARSQARVSAGGASPHLRLAPGAGATRTAGAVPLR